VENNEQEYHDAINNFQVGDKVRTITKKKIFGKGDEFKSSVKIYIVEEILNTKVKLEGIKRLYKSYELQRVSGVDVRDYIEDNEEVIPKVNKKQKHLLKREEIEEDNIVETKRERKKNPKYEE
jgi:hypothetical protein